MKWIKKSNVSPGIQEYHLIQDDLVLVIMKYNLEQQSVRIRFEEERQAFFMENTGYANRLIFKNVYGVDQGKFSHNNRSNTGRLEINNEVYDYHIVDNNQPKLIIHQHNKREPLAVCQIPAIPVRQSSMHEQAGIVLSVCWFAIMPPVGKKQDQ